MLTFTALVIAGQIVAHTPMPLMPAGQWSCTMSGDFVGTLAVEGPRYVFTAMDGVENPPGSMATEKARLGARTRASLVRVWDGPLKDTFGVSLGFYNRAADPQTLVFNIAPGKGLQCLRS